MQGLSRIDRPADVPSALPRVYFTRLRIGSDDVRLGPRGVGSRSGHELQPSANALTAEFVAPSTSRTLHYQYRLDSVDREWSRPTTERSLTLARVAPGAYRLLVRAV